MKILLVVHLFLPDYFSGTEVLTLHTALELTSRGHQVQILTGYPAKADMPDSDRFDVYEYQGLKVTRFKHNHAPMGNQDNVAEQEYDNHLLAARFTDLIQEFQPSVVHFFHLMRISASAIDVCWDQGLPMVLTPTDYWFVCPTSQLRLPDGTLCSGPDRFSVNCVRHLATLKKPGFITQILKYTPAPVLLGIVQMATLPLFKHTKPASLVSATSRRKAFLMERINRINRVLVPTRVMHDALLRQGLDPARIQRCAYGIQLPVVSLMARQGKRPPTLGVIGLGEHKGAHVAIQAVRQRPSLNLVLQIYGRPSDYPEYVEQLRNLANGDCRVQFCGTFANEKIGDILAQMDVLIVPSLWFENAPLVISSAQAVGVPVIGSDMAGIAELITDKDNGRLFPAGDAHRLAEIVTELALDPTQINQMSKRARLPKTIATYTDELVAVYGELVLDKGVT